VEIFSSRPQLAQKLMSGREPEEAADLAGMIFSLCGKAQRAASQAACEAARGLSSGLDVLRQRECNVLVELAQEHAWRLLLNWPEQAGRSPDMPSLLGLRQAAAEPARFAEVLDNLLETRFLGEPHSLFLNRDLAGFDAWRSDSATQIAKLFADLGEGQDPGISQVAFLPPLGSLDSVLAADLARQALDDAGYCAAPLWQGEAAETGAAARMSNHPMLAGWIVQRGRGAGARLLARLLELAGLPQRLRASPGEPDASVVRAWNLGENTGMAGVETSRGLLVHVVRLRDGRVADYRIVAPTEWNFHPAGPLTQALAGLEAGPDLESRARLVSQSLDPCVAYGVELSDA
jgi:coenzyme F420-reducing hydrogenase alpha subunit